MGGLATASVRGASAERAFEAMAPVYDDFTAHYEYDFWTAQLLGVLSRHGLQGRRLLDIGCGTGKSFLPMLSRGWAVTGYDISAAMLELARQKAGESVRLEVADMRAEPKLGEFDLVWALDDAINYLLSAEELALALRGLRSNLAPTGRLLFDVNELSVYRTFYAERIEIERDGRNLVWEGKATGDIAPGSICEFSCFEEAGPRRSVNREARQRSNLSVHRQRHFPEVEVLTAIDRAGLECLGVYGQSTDGVPRQPLDTSIHTKAIYVARAA